LTAKAQVLHNIPVRGKLLLALGFLAGLASAQNPVVIKPEHLANERIWPLLVGERMGFCVGDSLFRERLDRVSEGKVFFKEGFFPSMPRGSLPLSEIDSVLVWLPLHEEGAYFLVPVVYIGGGIMSSIPIFLLLDYISNFEAGGFNSLAVTGLAGSLTLAGVYYSYKYLKEAGRSDYKTKMFLKRLEELK